MLTCWKFSAMRTEYTLQVPKYVTNKLISTPILAIFAKPLHHSGPCENETATTSAKLIAVTFVLLYNSCAQTTWKNNIQLSKIEGICARITRSDWLWVQPTHAQTRDLSIWMIVRAASLKVNVNILTDTYKDVCTMSAQECDKDCSENTND